MKVIIVEDEVPAAEKLERYLQKYDSSIQVVAKFDNVAGTVSWLKENQNSIDLIFMDIQMPGLTGLQFIQSLTKRPMVILITAYKKFAPEGFDLDVVDYLVKPVGMDRFLKACYKAQELHQLRTAAGTAAAAPEFFFVNVDYSLVKVLFADIIWIEGSGDYVKIHLKSAPKPLLVRMSARALETELPADKFVRIHKSYIISIAAITAVRKNSVFIRDLELPVGETYREVLRQLTRRDV